MKIRLFIFLLLFSAVSKAAPPTDEGRTIFTTRCSGCHNINKIVTGPALSGVEKRRDINWIINFVHSSQTVIKSGDTYAVALFDKFNHIQMPDHPDLTADNIRNIVAYIQAESKPVVTEKPPFSKPSHLQPAYTPIAITDYLFFGSYLALVLILIAALLLAVQVRSYQRKKEGDM